MKIFAVKPEVLEQRKAAIIKTLDSAIGADYVLPAADRTIVADLAMSGVRKMFETLDMHMMQCATVMGDNGPAMEAIMILTMQEATFALEGVLQQRSMSHLDGIMAHLDKLAEADVEVLIEQMRAAGMPVPTAEEIRAKAEELKKAYGL